MSRPEPLERAAQLAQEYLRAIGERHVGALLSGDDIRANFDCEFPEDGEDALQVVEAIARIARDGTTASQGPRYFGFVTGGSLPVATAVDWLVSAWDQNAQTFVMSPLASVAEQIASRWLKELFDLPRDWSVGFPTGAQMANFTALLAARRHLLQRAGWDVERDGLFGAPEIDVVVGEEAHRTIFTSLRMLGLGDGRLRRVETDEQGRIRPDRLEELLASGTGPCVVCTQLGNVNTGACDPLTEIAAITRRRGAWLHVDGAFGMWAGAAESLRHLTAGIELTDSIATDAHKWLNVPYDSGIVFTAHPEAHCEALVVPAHYIAMSEGERDPRAFTPDESRRARGIPVYAALRALGRRGVAEMVERCCANAKRMAAALARHRQVRILNDVVLNQVLVQFLPPEGDPRDEAAFTDLVVDGIQKEGTCWLGATLWHGRRAARISISNWSTTAGDIDLSAAAILAVVDALA
jgi:glutamate/tyrosine decarboxylase-like PLP-dependent enzyme